MVSYVVRGKAFPGNVWFDTLIGGLMFCLTFLIDLLSFLRQIRATVFKIVHDYSSHLSQFSVNHHPPI
jgi:hypothetical protein